jgi:uncharacterized membrane protein
MFLLCFGLFIFLSVHSLRLSGDKFRDRWIARAGEKNFKLQYTVVSIVGFVLILVGFGFARENPLLLWTPWAPMRHVAALLTLISFIFMAAAYVPGNAIKSKLHHPMILAVKVWALAHLFSNASAAHVLLFGSFLVWSVLCFRAARRRDNRLQTSYAPGNNRSTVIAVALGGLAWALFALWGHGWLIGIRVLA